ncbi:DNA-3-methyladenine glycosylase family protein, partial [Nitratireductor sp. GCM10026969]|uniref:DNA-3-methyladenine glycosylase family protein n=1 Tax=Nitratireductor sp. GCM10026969 TaxID=3252645 RepID=UPI0036100FDC
QRALAALCQAIEAGSLDLDRLGRLPADDAIAAMTAVPGIGPWTAQVYLLVAAGHTDIFPAGDVALRSAVAHAFELDSRPDIKGLAAMAESWNPWRSAAARLFWAYYREMKGLEAAPAA